MSLSPNDIRNYDFSNQMRGYDKDEVDSFKEQVAAALEVQKQEALKLQMEVESLKSQVTGLKQFEDTIKSAAIDARRNADMTMQNARKEAELVLSRAREEAEKLIGSRAQQAEHMDAQISKLELVKKSYLNKLQNLISSHLELVDEVASLEAPVKPQMPQAQKAPAAPKPTAAQKPAAAPKRSDHDIEVTESEEMTSSTRETIATQPAKHHVIKTEDANAASDIVAITPTTAKTPAAPQAHQDDLTESLRKVVKDEQTRTEATADSLDDTGDMPIAKPSGGIDPELAAALEQYQHANPSTKTKTAGAASMEPNPLSAGTPKQGEVIETESLAEQVPGEFVAVKESSEPQIITGGGDENAPMDPNDLANTLDNVVKKFEEEMDRAERK
jgi:cell division initiation protein